MKLVSIQDIYVRLIEDGITLSRVKICSEATKVINAIGKSYTSIVTVPITVEIPSPGIIVKPEGAVDIISVKDLNGTVTALSIAQTVTGTPMFDKVPIFDAGCIPSNMYAMKDGSIIFHRELWGKKVELTYRTLPVATDGWPMVADTIVEAVVCGIEHNLVRGKMLSAALGNKSTNNMIIATYNEIKREYHRMVSQARASLAIGNESKKE